MIFNNSLFVTALIASLASRVAAHGAMVAVTGANGVTGAGMGINPATPRDGTRRNPFQQDTSIIRDEDIADGTAGPCGRTLQGGSNNVAAAMAAATTAGTPSAAADGTVTMTIHQINGDGAGPYTCDVSADGGATFTPATVTTNVPGNNGRSRARAQDFPLVAKMPAGMACAGGPDGNACIMRCRNPARAGPFGGCAVVTNAAPAAAAPPAAAAAPAAAAPPAAAPAAEAAAPATETADSATAAPATGAAAPAAAAPATGAVTPPAAVAAPPAAAAKPAVAAAKPAAAAGGAGAAGGALGGVLGGAGGAGGLLAKLTGAKRSSSKRVILSRIVGKRQATVIDDEEDDEEDD